MTSGNFSVRAYLPLIQKDSIIPMHGLAVYVNDCLLHLWKLWRFLLMFSTGFTSLCLTSFSSINHPLLLYAQFYVLLFNIDEVLLINLSPGQWNTGLVSSGASLTSWGEGASLALVGHPSSDRVTIKMLYGVDVLHQPASHLIFSYWVGSNWIWLYC